MPVSLAPQPRFKAFVSGSAFPVITSDEDGQIATNYTTIMPLTPLTAGKLYTYAAGTDTPLATYTSSTGLTQNTNPIILDINGEADVWLGDSAYKFLLKDSNGVTQPGWPVDNIRSIEGLVNALTANLAASGGADLVGYGSITVQDKLNETVSAEEKGAIGNGSNNDSTAWNILLPLRKGGYAYGTDKRTYDLDSPILLPDDRSYDMTIDGRGCTFRPRGTSEVFKSNDLVVNGSGIVTTLADATATVLSGAGGESLEIVVDSTAGFSVGQVCEITSNNSPTEEAYNYPSAWREIKAINTGTNTITLNHPFIFTYLGTITLRAWSNLKGDLYLKNMNFDGSLRAYSSYVQLGCCIKPYLYNRVVLENVRFKNFKTMSHYIQLLTSFKCREVILDKVWFDENQSLSDMVDVRNSHILNTNQVHAKGMHFGMTAQATMYYKASDCHIEGERAYEEYLTLPGANMSVRGFKTIGVGVVEWNNLTANDLESPFKLQVADRATLIGCKSYNGGQFSYNGQNCINIGSTVSPGRSVRAEIISCRVNYYGGNALYSSSSTILTVRDLEVVRCGGSAIISEGTNVTLTDSKIVGWGYNTPGTIAGVYLSAASSSHNIDGVEFTNGGDTASPCFDIRSASAVIGIRNISKSGNPLFAAANVAKKLISLDVANNVVDGAASFSGYKKSGTATIIGQVGKGYPFAVADNATFAFTMTDAKKFTLSTGGGASCDVFADYKQTTIDIQSNPSSEFEASATPTAGKTGIFKSANSHVISIINETGASVNYSIISLGNVSITTDPS